MSTIAAEGAPGPFAWATADLCPGPREVVAAWLPAGVALLYHGSAPGGADDFGLIPCVVVAMGSALPLGGEVRCVTGDTSDGLLQGLGGAGAAQEAVRRVVSAEAAEGGPLAVHVAYEEHGGQWHAARVGAVVEGRRRVPHHPAVRDHHDALAAPASAAGGTARLKAHLGDTEIGVEVPAGSDLARHTAVLGVAGVPYELRLGNGFDAVWVTAGGTEMRYILGDCAWAAPGGNVYTAGSAMLPSGDFMCNASEWLHFLDRAAAGKQDSR